MQFLHRIFILFLPLLLAFSSVADAAAYAYNAAGRVASASSASATLLTNIYDATGMRAQKVAGSTTSRFVRGLGAELLQEVTGTTRRNYIYANGLPIAQLNGTTLHYLHTDQRGAPVKATNSSKTVRWSTRYDPFGATVGLTNPGSLVMNLRLPGQYADSETGLYDNGFRTYNPATGRYLQSDLIGLRGGMNTYGYVGGNPFSYTDFWGLEYEWRGWVPMQPRNDERNLDPTLKNPSSGQLTDQQRQDISNTLNEIEQGMLSGKPIYSHPYRNFPDKETGAQMPECEWGYSSYVVAPISRKNHGEQRLFFPNSVNLLTGGTIYYSFNHGKSYIPIYIPPPHN